MGVITCVIPDKVEERMRKYVWHKYKGKGRHIGDVVETALTEFLDLHEDEVIPKEKQ